MKLIDFYKLLEEVFPYSTMPYSFRGKHHIVMDRVFFTLKLHIWYQGKCWIIPLDFEPSEKDREFWSWILLEMKKRFNGRQRQVDVDPLRPVQDATADGEPYGG